MRRRSNFTRVNSSAINTSAWQKLRAEILTLEPLCRRCAKRGVTTAAIEVHHIQYRSDRPDLTMEPSNLEPLCTPCHDEEHGRVGVQHCVHNLRIDSKAGAWRCPSCGPENKENS